jgi:hypothetical protein
MAETTTSPTNKEVKFRGKPSAERPRAADGMAALSPALPKPKKMRAKVKRAVKPKFARGMMSEAAMKKHLGDY